MTHSRYSQNKFKVAVKAATFFVLGVNPIIEWRGRPLQTSPRRFAPNSNRPGYFHCNEIPSPDPPMSLRSEVGIRTLHPNLTASLRSEAKPARVFPLRRNPIPRHPLCRFAPNSVFDCTTNSQSFFVLVERDASLSGGISGIIDKNGW